MLVRLFSSGWCKTSRTCRRNLGKLPVPVWRRIIGQDNAAFGYQLLHISMTRAEAEIQPHAVTDDLRRETMGLVRRAIGSVAYRLKLGSAS